MKISVVIPAYNCQTTIGRAIESVLDQTRCAEEVIVIDDGSKDKTAEIIRSYSDKVRLIQQDNAGVSVARNTGINAAAGDWIAFLDADDQWLPNKLKLQAEHLQRHPDLKWTTANYYCCQCRKKHHRVPDMSEESIRSCREHLNGREVFEDHLKAYSLLAKGHTDTMLIRRDLLIEAGMFLSGLKRMNDIDMWFRIAFIEPRIGFIFEPLAVYHLDITDSIVKVHTDWRLIDDFLRRQLDLAEKHHRIEAFEPCAKIAFACWIQILMRNNKGIAVRKLLRKYQSLITPKSRKTIWIGSFIPCMWTWRQNRKRKRYADG